MGVLKVRTGVPRRAPALALGKGPPPWPRSEMFPAARPTSGRGWWLPCPDCALPGAGCWQVLQAGRVPRGYCPLTCFNTIFFVPRVRRPAPSAPPINLRPAATEGKTWRPPRGQQGLVLRAEAAPGNRLSSRRGAHGPSLGLSTLGARPTGAGGS